MRIVTKGFIKIARTPVGNEPKKIKRAWVGAVFPVHAIITKDDGVEMFEVVGGKKCELRSDQKYYLVRRYDALMVMYEHNESAAEWLDNHGPQSGMCFTFMSREVEIIGTFEYEPGSQGEQQAEPKSQQAKTA